MTTNSELLRFVNSGEPSKAYHLMQIYPEVFERMNYEDAKRIYDSFDGQDMHVERDWFYKQICVNNEFVGRRLIIRNHFPNFEA